MESNILIVDDSEGTRYFLKEVVTELLDPSSCKVLEPDSADQAFALVEKHGAHLIFMDVLLPGMTGIAAAQKIKSVKSCSQTPLIFITGSMQAAAKAKASGLGDEVLQKPLDVRQIDVILKKYLQGDNNGQNSGN